MPFRISLPWGVTLRRSFMVKMNWGMRVGSLLVGVRLERRTLHSDTADERELDSGRDVSDEDRGAGRERAHRQRAGAVAARRWPRGAAAGAAQPERRRRGALGPAHEVDRRGGARGARPRGPTGTP